MFGPVSHGYRAMADAIVADAASVQAIIDDLETAARSDAAPPADSAEEIVDIGAIVTQIERDLAGLLADQRVELSISRVGGPFLGLASDANVRRMVGRLLTALAAVSDRKSVVSGKRVSVRVDLVG